MSGLTTRYRLALEQTRGPVDPFACDACLDVRALLTYARERGVRADELPLEDAARFVKPRSRDGAGEALAAAAR